MLPHHVSPNLADDGSDPESDKDKMDTNNNKSNIGPKSPSHDEYIETEEWDEEKSPAPECSNSELANIKDKVKQNNLKANRVVNKAKVVRVWPC
jgi:hypothetical protein